MSNITNHSDLIQFSARNVQTWSLQCTHTLTMDFIVKKGACCVQQLHLYILQFSIRIHCDDYILFPAKN